MKDTLFLKIDSAHQAVKISNTTNDNFLGVSWDVLLPSLIAIFASVVGYAVSSYLGRYRKAKADLLALKNQAPFVAHCFRLFIGSAQGQAVHFKNFAKMMNNLGTGDSNFYLMIQPDLEIKNMRALNRELPFNLFVRMKVGVRTQIERNFDDLFLAVGAILNIFERHEINYQEFIVMKEKIEKNLNTDELEKFIPALNGSGHEHDYSLFEEIQAIRTNLSVDEHSIRAIVPTIEAVRDAADRRTSKGAEKCANLARIFLFHWSEYDRLVKSQESLYSHYAAKIEEFTAQIELCITSLEKLPWKEIKIFRPTTWQ